MTDFERIVQIVPAYDRRDPDPKKNYGIHNAELRMILKGPHGVVQFVCSAGWQLPEVEEELERNAIKSLDLRRASSVEPPPSSLPDSTPGEIARELNRAGLLIGDPASFLRVDETDLVFLSMRPSGTDIGYHAPKPQYKNQNPISEKCEYLDGKPCYYDGSSMAAEKVFDLLVREGHEAVWAYLEDSYRSTFMTEEVDGES